MLSTLLRFSFKLTVSAVVVWLVIRQLDLSGVVLRLKAVSTGGALLVIFVLLLQCVVTSIRWEWIIRMMRYVFPFGAVLRTWLIGHFLGQGFPSTIGQDAFRVMVLRLTGIPTLAAFEIILLDRFTGVVGLVLLTAVTLPILASMVTDALPLFPLFVLVIGAILAVSLVFSRLPLPRLLSNVAGAAFILQFRSNLRYLVETRQRTCLLLALSLTAHVLTVVAAYVIARDGMTQISFVQCLAIIPPAILVSLIPVSIAGWGIREGSVVAGAILLGISSAEALFVSIMLGLGFLAVGVIGGLVWLAGGNRYLPSTQAGNVLSRKTSSSN